MFNRTPESDADDDDVVDTKTNNNNKDNNNKDNNENETYGFDDEKNNSNNINSNYSNYSNYSNNNYNNNYGKYNNNDNNNDDDNNNENRNINYNDNNVYNEIMVDYNGTLYALYYDSTTSFEQLKEQLNDKLQSKNLESGFRDSQYFALVEKDHNGIHNTIPLDFNDKVINYANKTIHVVRDHFRITIIDGLEIPVELEVSSDDKIVDIKEQYSKLKNVRLASLSLNGNEIIDQETLGQHGINKDGFTLVSRISITIEDVECGLGCDILVCEFWDMDNVLKTYLEMERRESHLNAKLYYKGDVLNPLKSVYSYHITNQSKLEYKVGPYNVLIYDNDNIRDINNPNSKYKYRNNKMLQYSQQSQQNNENEAISIEVFDYMTINDIKERYSRLTQKPFMANEKLISNDRQLEDNIALWKLRIRDNEPLMIEREQQDTSCEYICSECGNKVKLRRQDLVQCRECFHNVLYKLRTNRVCQYDCR